MAQSIEEKLIQAIERDDIKEFDDLMKNARCGVFRLGRFPVLSLMYLYNSKKIISAYGESLIKITAWEEMREPATVAKAFSEKAGKCLRLYLSEVVSPLEMLLILDRIKELKRAYPLAKPSSAVRARLNSIYSVKYSLEIKYEGDDIIIPRRPLSHGEKKKIATVCLCSFLAVAVAVAAPVTAIALIPEKDESEVTKFGEIDFNANETYTLKEDIRIPDNYSIEKMNCTIDGGGNKLILGKGANLGSLAGKISNLVIESSGSPIFSVISEAGELSSVTVNVSADIQTSRSSAFISLANYGRIDGIELNVSGKISAVVESSEISFGGMVLGNYSPSLNVCGTISNCTVNYSDFTLTGETYANGAFGGIAGYNNGAIVGCTVTGSIAADTFDLAGVCVENGGLLSKNINRANLSQVSDDDGWNPVVSGIVYSNTGAIEDCENRGSLTAKSTGNSEEGGLSVSVAGIAVSNYIQYIYGTEYGKIDGCINSGAITAECNEIVVVGGIVARLGTPISYCLSSGDISAVGKTAYVGGIAARVEVLFYDYWGFVTYCISESKINVAAEKNSCIGGIAGFVQQGIYNYSGGAEYFGGGVQNCIYLGEYNSETEYFGSIVGVCGKDIYNKNLYYYENEEYNNFDNNYYIAGSPSFGATVTGSEEFASVAGKGVTQITGDIEELELYREILNALAK